MELGPPSLPQLDKLDESAYPMDSFVGNSPFPEGGTTDEHFGGTVTMARGWGSPLSEPGSPEGGSPSRARARGSATIGGSVGTINSTLLPKVCL